MAYYAQIDDTTNRVLQIVVVDATIAVDEQRGIQYCSNLLGGSKWAQCYNDGSRGGYPRIGDFYVDEKKQFVPYYEQIQAITSNPYYGVFYNDVNSEEYKTGKYISSTTKPRLYKLQGDFIKFTTDYVLSENEQDCVNKAYELGISSISDIETENSVYINLPNNKSYCLIYRNGSSLFTKLILDTHFSELNAPTGQAALNRRSLPESIRPESEPIAIIRDPIDRFISAYALGTGNMPSFLPVDDFIDWLLKQDKKTVNLHFRPQVYIVGNISNVTYYDFATELEKAAEDLGLPTPLPVFNDTDPSKKPILTEDQIGKLSLYYAEDIELYNNTKQ